MKILIVEDEEKLARFVELELMHQGYETSKAFDGRTGLDLAVSGEFDLVLLDIMLPGINGIEVLRRIRKTSDIPVILLTARDSVMDKVSGLDTGADDYITKPFEIEELLARIRASLRKKSSSPASLSAQLSCGMLKMDTASHIVNYGNDTVELACMGVLKEYYRNGIGKELFECVKKVIREQGYSFQQLP